MFSVGNHDLGVNAYSERDLSFDQDDTRPVFKHFFPQNLNSDGGIPKLKDRKSYFTHQLGDQVLFLSIDSGYETEIADQEDFIRDELSKDYRFKFVQYHHPIYSACAKGEHSKANSEGKRILVPLFDKYGVTMAFENHVHGFKRTKPLKDGKEDLDGTIYIGDGSWGPLVGS